MTASLRHEQRGLVRILTLDRPSVRNAIDMRVMDELEQALEQAALDAHVRAVVLAATGPTFCSGGDLRTFATIRTTQQAIEMSLRMQRVIVSMRRSRLPIVAAVAGDAIGGGFELALGADIRVLAHTARLAFLHVMLGVAPAWRGVARVRELVGRSRAFDLLASGRSIDASEALSLGLADTCCDSADVRDVAIARAASYAERSPAAIAAIKAMLVGTTDEEAAMQVEAEQFAAAWVTDEHWALVERRPRPT